MTTKINGANVHPLLLEVPRAESGPCLDAVRAWVQLLGKRETEARPVLVMAVAFYKCPDCPDLHASAIWESELPDFPVRLLPVLAERTVQGMMTQSNTVSDILQQLGPPGSHSS